MLNPVPLCGFINPRSQGHAKVLEPSKAPGYTLLPSFCVHSELKSVAPFGVLHLGEWLWFQSSEDRYSPQNCPCMRTLSISVLFGADWLGGSRYPPGPRSSVTRGGGSSSAWALETTLSPPARGRRPVFVFRGHAGRYSSSGYLQAPGRPAVTGRRAATGPSGLRPMESLPPGRR